MGKKGKKSQNKPAGAQAWDALKQAQALAPAPSVSTETPDSPPPTPADTTDASNTPLQQPTPSPVVVEEEPALQPPAPETNDSNDNGNDDNNNDDNNNNNDSNDNANDAADESSKYDAAAAPWLDTIETGLHNDDDNNANDNQDQTPPKQDWDTNASVATQDGSAVVENDDDNDNNNDNDGDNHHSRRHGGKSRREKREPKHKAKHERDGGGADEDENENTHTHHTKHSGRRHKQPTGDADQRIAELEKQIKYLHAYVLSLHGALLRHNISLDLEAVPSPFPQLKDSFVEDEVVYVQTMEEIHRDTYTSKGVLRDNEQSNNECVVHNMTLHVQVGPGPVGVRMTPDLKIAEFIGLPNKKPSQLADKVPIGAELIMFDGLDVSGLREEDVRELIRRTSHKTRQLSFRVQKRVEGPRLASLRRAFDAVDADGNGYLCPTELQQALLAAGLNFNDDEVAAMLDCADLDDDGRVEFAEFVRMMEQ